MKTPPTAAPKPTFTHELANSDKSMPLGVSDMTPEDVVLDPLAGAGESRRFKAGSVIIVVVVVIACVGLWFMRTMSHVSIAAAAKSTDATKRMTIWMESRPITGIRPGRSLGSWRGSRRRGRCDPLPREFACAAVKPSHFQESWSRARACPSPGGDRGDLAPRKRLRDLPREL